MAGKKILLVDDANTVIMLEQMMLNGEGFDIETANNGKEALVRMAQSVPDLVLLDFMMPELNGLETLKKIRSEQNLQDVPVIMVTTKGEAKNVEACYEAGCNDFITKPFTKIDLMNKIKTHLR